MALYVFNELSSASVVALARMWLEHGICTDTLIDITWDINPTMSDVGPLFEKTHHRTEAP